MTNRRARVARFTIVLAIVASVIAACSRGRPRVAATPTTRDTTRTAAVPVVKPIDSVALRARLDSARRDSIAKLASADSAKRPAAKKRASDDPTSRCRVVTFEQTPTTRAQSLTDATGKYITFLGGGVISRCEGIRNRLASDSAESYETTGQLILVGNVSYDEPQRVHLTSNRLTYYRNDERLVAEGNVVVTLPSGSTLVGPRAEYFRESPPLRTRARLAADGRPVLRVIGQGKPATGATTKPTMSEKDTATIIANLIIDDADSLVYASGQVQITRTDVTATADSATFDQGTEQARLLRNAKIEGQKGRPFALSGALIDLFSRDRDLTRIIARGTARVVSKELDLKSDTVDLRIRDNRVERAYAWGPSRATATSTEQDITADSIEAVLPEQRIREMHAVRRAVARTLPDSTKTTSKERDMLAGDTIVARFDTTAIPVDTTKNPPIKQIVANGHALSVYQIPSSQGRTALPGVNYVRGRLITVAFDSGQVQSVTVTDSAAGLYLEPSTDTTPTTNRRATPRANTPTTRPRAGSVIPGQRTPFKDESLAPIVSSRSRMPFISARRTP